LNGPDPGLVSGYETEADPDVEWAGAVATGAKVQLFVSNSTNSSSGIDLSALYSIDNY
jgi:subtilase family serine protease